MIVVDASVALLWLVDMPSSKRAERLLDSEEPLVAPDLIVPELTNAVWKSVAFAELSPDDARDAIGSINRYFSDIVPTYPFRMRALSIAIELKHPAYDCFYLALAEHLSCNVITADERLIKRCANSRFEAQVSRLA